MLGSRCPPIGGHPRVEEGPRGLNEPARDPLFLETSQLITSGWLEVHPFAIKSAPRSEIWRGHEPSRLTPKVQAASFADAPEYAQANKMPEVMARPEPVQRSL